MKILLRAATALILATPALAQAQEITQPNGPYMSLLVGAGVPNSTKLDLGPINDRAQYEAGPVAGIAGGWKLDNGVRAEFEYTYRQNSPKQLFGLPTSGQQSINLLMVNGLYEFSTGGKFSPYAGVGVGVAFNSGSLNASAVSIKPTGNTFAVQGIVGVAVAVTSYMSLTADYRYLHTGSVTYKAADDLSSKVDYDSHTILLGMRFPLGNLLK